MNRPRILVGNTDPGIRRLLRKHFGNAGYTVITADSGRAVFDQIRRGEPDVVIISSEMGDVADVELVRRAHSLTGMPLLVLMAPNHVATPDAILDAGADDCLEEPFLLEELAARTRRLLHRTGIRVGPTVLMTGLGMLEINVLERSVTLAGKPLPLSRKEFDFLALLANANGETVSHAVILTEVWNDSADSSARQNLRRVVGRLRRKIEPEPHRPVHLVSLRGSGYRLALPEAPQDGE